MTVAETSLYTIKELNTGAIENGEVNMNEIIGNQLNGFVVTDFLSEEEIQHLLKGFKNLNENDLIHINSSFNSYPMSFAQYDQMLQKKVLTDDVYFEKSNRFISHFPINFQVDLFEKLKSLFSKIKNSPELAIPTNPSKSGQYIPFTFRELFPGEGCLKAHCENLFFQEFPSFFDKITAFSTLENQLSFFIVLQKPAQGGELTLFDILWNPAQNRLNDDEIKLEDGKIYSFEDHLNLKRDHVHPPAGSLVVFTGGKIWHRVEKVMQAPSRITIGGFLSFSNDGKKLYAWS